MGWIPSIGDFMNVFFSPQILILIGFVFLLLVIFIVANFGGKRLTKSDGIVEADEFEEKEGEKLAERGVWSKISQNLSTPISPELEIGTQESPRFQKKEYFFSYQERKFFENLSASVDGVYQIFAKVRMADVLFLANEPTRRKYYNSHIRCRHFDYLLCEPSKQKPVIAIELDDSSHRRYDRKASDEFKDKACSTARLPLLRIKLPYKYSHEELLNLIQAKIEETQ